MQFVLPIRHAAIVKPLVMIGRCADINHGENEKNFNAYCLCLTIAVIKF